MSIPGSATPLLLAATAAAAPAAAFQVDRSLRFNEPDSAHLNRTPTSASNRRTWTWSGWVKLTNSTEANIFTGGTNNQNDFAIRIENGMLAAQEYSGSWKWRVKTTALHRDFSAWYHFVVAFDSTQSTSSDRIKIYVNGVQQTSFSTSEYPSQNFESLVNKADPQYFAYSPAYNYSSFYLAETHFIDGQALAPTDFGETDSDNNWNPKDFSGTYGTNGFHLDFSDNSINEALGYDSSVTAPTVNPDAGFEIVTYTGNGSTQAISSLSFQPDFVWTAVRDSTGYIKYLFDSVRGATVALASSHTQGDDAETTLSTSLTSFDPNGFTLGSNGQVNENNRSMVAWCWKAGGVAVPNSDGSIDSQVSANTDHGFSIVTYAGTSNAGTVGHGLGAVPKMIFFKARNAATNWQVYHDDGTNERIFEGLNTDSTGSTTINNMSSMPSSTVLSLAGGGYSINSSGKNHVAYCWSEVSGFSKFGSFTHPSTTSLDFGFKPKFWLVKRTDSSGPWYMFDAERDNFDDPLSANTNGLEGSGFAFTVGNTGISWISGSFYNGTYIYAAFADRPGNNFDVNNLVAVAGKDGKSGLDIATWDGNGGTQKIGPVYSNFGSGTVSGTKTYDLAFDGSTSTFCEPNDSTTVSFDFTGLSGGGIPVSSSLRIYLNKAGTPAAGHFTVNGTNLGGSVPSGGWLTVSNVSLLKTITLFHQSGASSVELYAVEVDGTVLTDGNGTNFKFKPDFVWIKNTNGAHNHMLFDIVRGAGADLQANSTATEGAAGSNDLTSFDQNGFSLGSNNAVNQSSRTYVAWAWNAGANSNKTYTVKVVSDSGNKYRFDDFGTSAVTLDLAEGSTYIFDQSDSSNAGHPIRFGTSANGTDYTTGVTHTGTPGSAGAKTTLVLGTGVSTLYYSCQNHSGMGGQINTNSTAGASNFDGSIQSTVKANQEYGFSVVTWTGSASNATIGHGLNAAPQWILLKFTGSTSNWSVYHSAIGNTKRLVLNSAGSTGTSSTYWQDTSPTSSVFSVGSDINDSTDIVAYCWSEIPGYSKFGSYAGTGSAVTVITGFKPSFILVKSTSGSRDWLVWDSERGASGGAVVPNLSSAPYSDSTYNGITFNADGFTIMTGDSTPNMSASGETYIYVAFAGTPPGEIIDSLIDTPTNYDASSGNNGGNYATFNPLSAQYSTANHILENGNLQHGDGTSEKGNYALDISTIAAPPSGKWYWEMTTEGNGSNERRMIAIMAADANFAQYIPHDNSTDGLVGIWLLTGQKIVNGSKSSYTSSFREGNTVGVALDQDNQAVNFYLNGEALGSISLPSNMQNKSIVAAVSSIYEAEIIHANFGQRPFAYTPPGGYKSLCTQNLPDPTIADGSTVFDAVLYTGNQTARSITGLSFSPDLVTVKNRNRSSYNHYWVDIVRGSNSNLYSNSAEAQQIAARLSSLDSAGFSLTNHMGPNYSGDPYVAWAWDAGTSTTTNTDGTITSSVRANASAGFSIVSYTGTGSNATVGHGLNAAPEMVLYKSRGDGNDWMVYHIGMGAAKSMLLNSTSAEASRGDTFNNNAPTSSVLHIGTSATTSNTNSAGMIAYCFAPVAGYSSFGKYTGNGSTDGPFVFTGFRPALLAIKRTDSTGAWKVLDTTRSPFNVASEGLDWNTGGAEFDNSENNLDILSNGFKLKTSHGARNASNGTFVYMAWAEHPFKTARAR